MPGVGQLDADATVLFNAVRANPVSHRPCAVLPGHSLHRAYGYRPAGGVCLRNCRRFLRGCFYLSGRNSHCSQSAAADLDKISAGMLHTGFLLFILSVTKGIRVSARIQFGNSNRSPVMALPGGASPQV